jgi:hypothetical protein
MHCTDELDVVVTFAIVVAAAYTSLGAIERTAYGSANLIVDANRLDDTPCPLDGSTNFPEVVAGKTG